MAKTKYEVVPHDGGWAYKSGGVFSEAFPSHDEALEAARIAAQEHQSAGKDEEIEYQDGSGNWRQEHADGEDRPDTEVVDRSNEPKGHETP
ncbi:MULTISPECIES: DUF2188 domain-containing protein [unclassified Ensifer]|uniref:DUF2188 domain-containing protein n=1 Tax=unclassified Ensifer TaxID=2633371 RepID=UPI0008134E1E|nr:MULTISPECIES: DUF2188 domain-containing protein [unclassified Ensifer]OCP24861.1 hypothetical protein BC361_19860 [Ensifer sp. LC54]OCP25800.1 hypothetical protein BC363_18675 [Ensifer sp. LC384]OCP35929.1 hypothetical protein BC360_26345 [Ensifer sp. LC163]